MEHTVMGSVSSWKLNYSRTQVEAACHYSSRVRLHCLYFAQYIITNGWHSCGKMLSDAFDLTPVYQVLTLKKLTVTYS